MSYELYQEDGKWKLSFSHALNGVSVITFPTYNDACDFLVKLCMGD